jgi:hypothetical protein
MKASFIGGELFVDEYRVAGVVTG